MNEGYNNTKNWCVFFRQKLLVMMRLIHLKYFEDVCVPKKCQSFLEMKTYFSKCIPHREDTLIFTLLSPKVPNVIQVLKFFSDLAKT